jgi:hypothetical protein
VPRMASRALFFALLLVAMLSLAVASRQPQPSYQQERQSGAFVEPLTIHVVPHTHDVSALQL